MTEQVAAVLSSAAFKRAPILSRLLQYLLDKTLAGEADRLKAYTVAVDGLSRSPDFDTQLDSYPRVQIVRLRKALDKFYTENPQSGSRVFLGTGSYRLRLGERDVAYPAIGHRAVVEGPVVPEPMPSARSKRVTYFPRLVVGLAIVIVLFAFITVTTSRQTATAQRAAASAETKIMKTPVVAVVVASPVSSPRERAAAAVMADGVRRSWVARVRHDQDRADRIAPPPAYRISIREAVPGRLAIELIDARSETLIWTGSEDKSETRDLRDSLAPTIATLSGPFGVIARAETARLNDTTTGSYACVLRYFAFVKELNSVHQRPVEACLAKPVDDPRLGPMMVALQSAYALESGAPADRAAHLDRAEGLARLAAQQNADDPYVQYSLARVAYLRSRCGPVGFHGDRAVGANPYDSMIVTVLATMASQCNNPDAAALLDRAYRIRNDNDLSTRNLLIFATLSQGRDERLSEIGYTLRPAAGFRLGSYLLGETMIAAAKGRHDEAAARWAEFRQFYAASGSSDYDRLKMVVPSDPLRKRVLTLLRRHGVAVS